MFIDSKITFDSVNHRYYDENNTPLISVTQILSLYKKPFDHDNSILKKCAAKKGMTEEALKAEWNQTKIDGCNRGTSIHKSIEHYVLTKKIAEDENKDIIQDFKKLKFKGILHTEVLIGDPEIGVAGTSDLLEEYSRGNINVYDAKSNKKYSTYCPFGNRMLYPVDHLYQTDENVYSLQLAFYAYILEKKFGYWVDKLTILWINPKTRKIEVIPVLNRRSDVENILDHYNKNYRGQDMDKLIQK